MPVKIKRAYVKASAEDGVRILVDRFWPRGLSKEDLKIDEWMKDLAPSNELRKWFNHRPERFDVFTSKYLEELSISGASLERLKEVVLNEGEKGVTLVYGAKDEQHNQAVVLKAYLDEDNRKKA